MKELIWGKSTISLRLQCLKGPIKRTLNLFYEGDEEFMPSANAEI